jgi:hypothetical protein
MSRCADIVIDENCAGACLDLLRRNLPCLVLTSEVPIAAMARPGI